MDKAELKRVLRHAQTEPVHAAFALGADGKAVLVMDRRKQGRALETQLRNDAPDSKNHRWGSVTVTPDDPKLARFTINKASSGMSRKLVLALKGTGFSKVEIVLEDGTAVETHEEPDEQAQGGEGHGAAQAAAQAGGDAAQPAASHPGEAHPGEAQATGTQPGTAHTGEAPHTGDALPAASSGNGSAAPAGKPDAKALTQDLTGLIHRMLEAIRRDPSQKAALAELATDAQASLKRGDLDQAAAGIEILRQAIGDVLPPGDGAAAGVAGHPGAAGTGSKPAAGADGTAASGHAHAAPSHPGEAHAPAPAADGHKEAIAAAAKGHTAWRATQKRLDDEVQKVHDAIEKAFQEHGIAEEVTAALQGRFAPVRTNLQGLGHTLDELAGNKDPAKHAALVQGAHQVIERCKAYVAGEPFIAHLDRNPFAPVAVAKTLDATLTALSRAIR